MAVGLSEFHGRFLSLEQLTEAFSIPTIGTITVAETSIDLALQRRSAMLFGGGVGALMLGYLIVLLLFHSQLATAQGSIL